MIRVCVMEWKRLLDNRWGHLMEDHGVEREAFEPVLARIKNNSHLVNTVCTPTRLYLCYPI